MESGNLRKAYALSRTDYLLMMHGESNPVKSNQM